jgi:predicted GNAT family N-acyltransferase
MLPKKQTLQRPEIRKVGGAVERERVYRFWYDTYVTEMRRPVKDPDHERRILTDELESHSTILAAHAEGAIVGTVRLNFPSRGSTSYYEELYQLDPSESHRAGAAIVTKYMVEARYRSTALPYELACAALVECVDQAIETAYMDCNEHLLSYFTTLGFVEHITAVHPEFGPVRVMKYDLSNPQHTHGLLGRYIKTGLHAARESRQAIQSPE